ncbi:HK97 family phage prohead protease [Occallatibacter riparius]|uniref:HK97 family phage prohead protease n=1 Tax=Occallatibacter riparius TaxID=1002689 RepID=A0A9J7BUG9_9BACT|nr:HK97 family phage prohead protease [Occallatibacter riparius]UWZ84645.1 HK97 family phage prohead protease [Occallatibacter riparius]
MKNKRREMRLSIKSVSEDGTFEGMLSPYNNVDDGGDVVEPGAFTKTLQENGSTVPMLWQHKADCPIGELELKDTADGLACSGKLLLEIPEAKKAYLLMKAKIVKGLSIGYDAIKAQVVDGVRHLKEIRLWEGSVVTFPMNTLAGVTDVKAQREEKGDFNEELHEQQMLDAWYQIPSALRSALYSAVWQSGAKRADIIAASETAIDQFRAAYMEFLPQYLDVIAELYGMDTKAWAGRRETKDGRKLSAATKGTLSECHGHMKSAFDILAALLDDEAGEDVDDDSEDATSKSAAARQHKSKPEDGAPGDRSKSLGSQELHLAADSLEAMRALLRA